MSTPINSNCSNFNWPKWCIHRCRTNFLRWNSSDSDDGFANEIEFRGITRRRSSSHRSRYVVYIRVTWFLADKQRVHHQKSRQADDYVVLTVWRYLACRGARFQWQRSPCCVRFASLHSFSPARPGLFGSTFQLTHAGERAAPDKSRVSAAVAWTKMPRKRIFTLHEAFAGRRNGCTKVSPGWLSFDSLRFSRLAALENDRQATWCIVLTEVRASNLLRMDNVLHWMSYATMTALYINLPTLSTPLVSEL